MDQNVKKMYVICVRQQYLLNLLKFWYKILIKDQPRNIFKETFFYFFFFLILE